MRQRLDGKAKFFAWVSLCAALLVGLASSANAENAEPFTATKSAVSPFYEKVYSKEEWQWSLPANPSKELPDYLTRESLGFFQGMTARQVTPKHIETSHALLTEEISARDYGWHVATMRELTPRREANAEGFRLYVKGQFDETLSDRVKRGLPYFDKFQSGMKFNLSLGSWIGGMFDDKPAVANHADIASAANKQVKYGLVLQEIKPDLSSTSWAYVSDSPGSEFINAGRAEVVWDVGPVGHDTTGNPLFSVPNHYQPAPGAAPRNPKEESPKSLWQMVQQRKFFPSLDFTGNIAPQPIGQVQAVGAGAEGPTSNLPGIEMTLTQKDGLYTRKEVQTTKGERVLLTHHFRLPIYQQLAVDRHYDENGKPTQTAIANILVSNKLPSVNIHMLHLEKRRNYSAAHAINGTHHLNFVYRGKSEVDPDPNTAREAYSLGYDHLF